MPNLHVIRVAIALAAALVAIPAAQGIASASADAKSSMKPNTFQLSGQVSGKLTLDSSVACAFDNVSTSDGATTVRVYLTGRGNKPKSGVWYLLLEGHGSKISLPAASPASVALGATNAATNDIEWASTPTTGSGSVKLGAHDRSGSVNVTLPPGSNQTGAKGNETIVGAWSCSKRA
jgi:hypothetical protein